MMWGMIQGEQDASQLFGKIYSVFPRSCCPLFLFKCLASTSEKPRNFIQNIKIIMIYHVQMKFGRVEEINEWCAECLYYSREIDDYVLLVL